MSKENTEFTVEQIKELITSLGQNKMKSLKVKKGDYSLSIEGAAETVFVSADAGMAVPMPAVTEPMDAAAPAAASGGNVVTSPMVGTYYESPSPESPPFVTVGQQVKVGDVLFIIEAMKLMNEVVSAHDGIVTEINVVNAQAVEYGQPVLTIK